MYVYFFFLHGSPPSHVLQINNFFSGSRNIVWISGQTVPQYYKVEYLPAWGFVGMQLIFPAVFFFFAW